MESDVTFLTPRSVPGVLDQPVWCSRIFTVSDKSDTVVKLLWITEEWVHDTSHVHLEPTGVNGSGEWTSGSKSRGNDLLISGDHFPLGDSTVRLVFFGVAGAISSGVFVVRFKFESSLLEENESVLHETTVATLVGFFVAVDEFLLGEREELFVFEEVLTLDVGDGRESPAGTALALVFDWGDSTVVSPIVAIWSVHNISEEVLLFHGDNSADEGIILLKGEVLLLELFFGHISELGDTVFGGTLVVLVHPLGSFEIGLENVESVPGVGFGCIGIGFSVLDKELFPLVDDFWVLLEDFGVDVEGD